MSEQAAAVELAPPTQVVSHDERIAIELRNRSLLEHELLEKQLVFESRPYEAHIQFSNFCNMSCIMCYGPGGNPPLKKMSPEILAKVREQIAPSLSIVIPYGGSEPLVVTWDDARDLATRFSIDLRVTTNVQYLDAARFDELKGITETLFLSIDSHNREVFEKIRPGSKPDKVFENLECAARLATKEGVECLAQVVFMTENAPQLPETVAYLADIGISSVNVLQLIDVNGRSEFLDPLKHFSADYVEWIKRKCVEVARAKKARFIWNVARNERWDFRDEKDPPDERKDWNHRWEQRMKRFLPGYCMNVFNRVQIDAGGEVMPCAYATDGELLLGSLVDQDFDQIWNSPNAQDLRRGHATWDYPSLCKSCLFVNLPPAQDYLPFVEAFLQRIGETRQRLDCSIELLAPDHMTRGEEAPWVRIARPDAPVETYYLVLALGGESDQVEAVAVEPHDASGGTIEFRMPAQVWSRLRVNLGYWWAIFGVGEDESAPLLRSSEIRCLIRHRSISRLAESDLRYPDDGHLPVVDLGGAKPAGFAQRDVLPARPALGERRLELASRGARRLSVARREDERVSSPPITPDEYQTLVSRVRKVVSEALPADATVLVVSRGDERLLELDTSKAWHFPCDPGGGYAGFHPPDSGWAIDHLRAARLKGGDYLLLPATALWWLDHYRDFAKHLWDRCPAVVNDPETCLIFGLTAHPALYGRAREMRVRSHAEAGPIAP
jgi:radical SAM protein with 4Fe4S-binding SPASM domain